MLAWKMDVKPNMMMMMMMYRSKEPTHSHIEVEAGDEKSDDFNKKKEKIIYI